MAPDTAAATTAPQIVVTDTTVGDGEGRVRVWNRATGNFGWVTLAAIQWDGSDGT